MSELDTELREVLIEALKWYGEQARLCRLIQISGDAGRRALIADGGKRAQEVLALYSSTPSHDKQEKDNG